MAPSLPDLSLADWAVLGVVVEGPTHGWPIVREFAPDGPLGQVWTVTRPLVYRSLATLEAGNFVEPCGETRRGRGPVRAIVRATPKGRNALRRWLSTPVEHVRDVRNHLLVKLALLDRSGRPRDALVEAQLARLAPVFDAVRRLPHEGGFEGVLGRWRQEQALAVERFLRSL
jgi:DNA-binding PadR family transcriptional regulator